MNKSVESFKASNVELLASYADQALKGKFKLGDNEMDGEIDRILNFLTFVVDKDVFIEEYRKHLAKRLLEGRSASRDAEKSAVSKIKVQYGIQFTSKLEGMLRDFEQSMFRFLFPKVILPVFCHHFSCLKAL